MATPLREGLEAGHRPSYCDSPLLLTLSELSHSVPKAFDFSNHGDQGVQTEWYRVHNQYIKLFDSYLPRGILAIAIGLLFILPMMYATHQRS